MRIFLAAAVLLASAASALAVDSVKRLSGTSINGTIRSITKYDVTIERQVGGQAEKVPLNDLDTVSFDGEPTPLKSAKTNVHNGDYDSAQKNLARVEAASITRPEIKQELEFYKAYVESRIALGTGDTAAKTKAGAAMYKFVQSNPDSYHALAANEIVGDLMVALAKYAEAQQYYAALEQSPFDDFKMKAGVAKGKALLAENKHSEALAAFEAALRLGGSAKGAMAEQQRFAATLGKAECVAQQNPDEAIKLVDEVIVGLSPEDSTLMAQAYVTKGNCYLKKPDSQKQALLAFLHVDRLYFSHAPSHKKALQELAKLWADLGKPERQLQCMQTLKERYP